jgi:hypothetical protein
MTRYMPNSLQRYQKASHMWDGVQQPQESVDSYITAIKTAANQTQLKDEQQLCFCVIRGLRPNLRSLSIIAAGLTDFDERKLYNQRYKMLQNDYLPRDETRLHIRDRNRGKAKNLRQGRGKVAITRARQGEARTCRGRGESETEAAEILP